MKKIFLVSLLLLGLTCPAMAQDLPTLSVKQVQEQIAAAKGKVVMLNFFASWCPPCREEIPGLNNLYKEFKDKGLIILGLSVDQTPSDLQKFLKTMPINYPVAFSSEDLARFYSVSSIPHNAIYDKNGKLVGNQPGYIEEAELRKLITSLLK